MKHGDYKVYLAVVRMLLATGIGNYDEKRGGRGEHKVHSEGQGYKHDAIRMVVSMTASR